MADERVLDAEAVEEPALDGESVAPAVRALPERRSQGELDSWRGEVKVIAVVAAGGLACGAAAVAALSAAKSHGGGRSRSLQRRSGKRDVLASRSFLVDVHLLDR